MFYCLRKNKNKRTKIYSEKNSTFFKHHPDNVFLKKTAFRKFSISFLVPLV